jgi:hypothetical protein
MPIAKADSLGVLLLDLAALGGGETRGACKSAGACCEESAAMQWCGVHGECSW